MFSHSGVLITFVVVDWDCSPFEQATKGYLPATAKGL